MFDLKFLKECKTNEVQPNFTKVKLANNLLYIFNFKTLNQLIQSLNFV